MTEQRPSKDQVSEAAEIARSFFDYAIEQGMHEVGIDPIAVLMAEIEDLQQDLIRTESARVAILAENEHYKSIIRGKTFVTDAGAAQPPEAVPNDGWSPLLYAAMTADPADYRGADQSPADSWDANGSPVEAGQ